MTRNRQWIKIVASLVVCGSIGLSQGAMASMAKSPAPGIHVNVPVKINHAKVVFNMDHRAFVGDTPVGLKYMEMLSHRFKAMGVDGKIIGLFQGQMAYLTLNDKAYDAARHVKTGNPYKPLIAKLMKNGVDIEECAVSMKGHHWTNANLLPRVRVTTGAVIRLIQLHQQGYTEVDP
ncbi:MAG TPA: hypothetical protein DEP05_06385 [Betaproteobacteria bacterium]|nr:hypothetical protein [Betaproteobacteria bacterium]